VDAPALFIGVVSHERSRFLANQGSSGLAYTLARELPGTEVQVNTRNLFDESGELLGLDDVQASLTAELDVERRWSEFLDSPRRLSSTSTRAARLLKRRWQRLRPPAAATVRRLFNIEMSHLDLMRRGLASRAPWVLILEDDAWATDIGDLATGLRHLMQSTSACEGFAYVNLSDSFDFTELRVNHLLSPAEVAWNGSRPRVVLRSSRPATNTVCAILYSAEFLATLLTEMETLPVKPVIPIDWKLNAALMKLFDDGHLDETACLFIEPGPITQLSMQTPGILPE